MSLIEELAAIQEETTRPFLIYGQQTLSFDNVREAQAAEISAIQPGDTVALIGDFDPPSIRNLLMLIDRATVVVPLTRETQPMHEYFFDAANVDWIVEGQQVIRRTPTGPRHPLMDGLRASGAPGLVLFSSGTTGRPKAILHDFSKFLVRYRTPRPALRTLSFLLFDHIGGVNTLFHTLFNGGQVVIPQDRTPEAVAADIDKHAVELLPTSPTFLRMMLLSGIISERAFPSLRVITYGTERMDQGTLDRLAALLPQVDFRQTYGMSELGILRVKSRARNSLWMQVGGEGVETRVVDSALHIRAAFRMLGYLNAPSPFDAEAWYDTGDVVEQDGAYIHVVGRTKEVINVGGIKVLPSEIERVGLDHPNVLRCKARGVPNPLTGQHIEVVCELRPSRETTVRELKNHFRDGLPESLLPHRVTIGTVGVNHRFKQE